MWASLFFVLYVLPLVFCYHGNLQDQLNDDFAENMDNDEREFQDAFSNDGRMRRIHPFHKDWKEGRMRSRDALRNQQEIFRREEENGEVGDSVFVKRSSQPTELSGLQSVSVQGHNAARDRHQGTGAVTYDSVLEDHAIAYAMKLTRENKFDHDKNELKMYSEGENLYQGFLDDPKEGICVAMYKWYNELRLFNYGKLTGAYNFLPAPEIGHFTQMVWKSSTRIGCGGAYVQTNDSRGKFIVTVVCRYKKQGNVFGKFPDNVGDLKSGKSKNGFTSRDEVCGGCVDSRSDCAAKSGHCSSPFFPEIAAGCPKTCGKC